MDMCIYTRSIRGHACGESELRERERRRREIGGEIKRRKKEKKKEKKEGIRETRTRSYTVNTAMT